MCSWKAWIRNEAQSRLVIFDLDGLDCVNLMLDLNDLMIVSVNLKCTVVNLGFIGQLGLKLVTFSFSSAMYI
ncbi:hypothetical protein HanIR_Chr11g0529511 [Helianthus annuus]|nr:hypothetical protein HanIR_Chr11g0529511 [Helianthus annuus]